MVVGGFDGGHCVVCLDGAFADQNTIQDVKASRL